MKHDYKARHARTTEKHLAPDARCTAGCTCTDCVAANALADRFDAMESRQAEAEERLNDYRYDSEEVSHEQ